MAAVVVEIVHLQNTFRAHLVVIISSVMCFLPIHYAAQIFCDFNRRNVLVKDFTVKVADFPH